MEMREYIEAIAESCRKLIISKPATKQEEYRKIIVQKKEAFFQMEKYTDKQVFHENLSVEELETALEELMQNHFRQLNGFDTEAEHILLVSKKGVPSYKKKKLQNAVNETATHNRKKNYLLKKARSFRRWWIWEFLLQRAKSSAPCMISLSRLTVLLKSSMIM